MGLPRAVTKATPRQREAHKGDDLRYYVTVGVYDDGGIIGDEVCAIVKTGDGYEVVAPDGYMFEGGTSYLMAVDLYDAASRVSRPPPRGGLYTQGELLVIDEAGPDNEPWEEID